MTAFLKKEYGTTGKGFEFDGKQIAVWFDEGGMSVGYGTSATEHPILTMEWKDIEQNIRRQVENGQVWSKKLYDGSYAVGFFHVDPYFILWDQEDAEAMQMREYAFDFDLKQLGIEGKAMVRDLWRQKDLGEVNGIFRTEVPYHGVTFVKITPAK